MRNAPTAYAWLLMGVGLFSQALRARGEELPSVSPANEYAVKAAFLYNFGRYVQWPEKAMAGAADPFVIGVAGEDPFGGLLDEIAAKKTIQGRPILVRRFASVEEYGPPCHILFVSRSLPGDQQAAMVQKTEGEPVFVVGETPGFAERGGMANFFLDGDRVRFEIHPQAARRAQLRMDAQLLKLGKRVAAPRAAATD